MSICLCACVRTFLSVSGTRRPNAQTIGVAISLFLLLTSCELRAQGDDGGDEAILPGRIYAEANVREQFGNDRDETRRDPIISIDPNTGEWTELTPADAKRPLLSPDGRILLYNYHLSVVGCRTDKPQDSDVIYPSAFQNAWSPDGKEVIISFVKNFWEDHRDQRFITFRVPAFDRRWRDAKKQLGVPETDLVYDWSSDGEWIVTGGEQGDRNNHIFVMRLDGTDERRLTVHSGWKPKFSPDGKKVVYLDGRDLRSIRVIDIDGTNERNVLAADETFGVNGAVFSPDGQWLAVNAHNWSKEPGRIAADNSVSDFRLLIVDLNGKIHKTLRPASKGQKTAWIHGGVDWAN